VGQQLGAGGDLEVAIQSGHVLMSGGLAQAEARRDLFFAVTFEETRERLAQPGR